MVARDEKEASLGTKSSDFFVREDVEGNNASTKNNAKVVGAVILQNMMKVCGICAIRGTCRSLKNMAVGSIYLRASIPLLPPLPTKESGDWLPRFVIARTFSSDTLAQSVALCNFCRDRLSQSIALCNVSAYFRPLLTWDAVILKAHRMFPFVKRSVGNGTRTTKRRKGCCETSGILIPTICPMKKRPLVLLGKRIRSMKILMV